MKSKILGQEVYGWMGDAEYEYGMYKGFGAEPKAGVTVVDISQQVQQCATTPIRTVNRKLSFSGEG